MKAKGEVKNLFYLFYFFKYKWGIKKKKCYKIPSSSCWVSLNVVMALYTNLCSRSSSTPRAGKIHAAGLKLKRWEQIRTSTPVHVQEMDCGWVTEGKDEEWRLRSISNAECWRRDRSAMPKSSWCVRRWGKESDLSKSWRRIAWWDLCSNYICISQFHTSNSLIQK